MGASVSLDITSATSIRGAASEVAYGLMKYYHGNTTGGTPGILPPPYYWWVAGAMFGEMVEYWYYTGDTTYVNQTTQALIFQAGYDQDFMPANQTKSEGNDDQVFWAFAAMSAAELGFPDPSDKDYSWLSMAQSVFDEQAYRWDNATCGGGLRWQIFPFNTGYTYKNTVSEAGFFQLAARLARYTDNSTYVDWAEKMWNWYSGTALYNETAYTLNDGASIASDCTQTDETQWSYNYGSMIAGLAYMYNHTQDTKWLEPLNGLLNTTFNTFFLEVWGNDKIMVEGACQPYGTCNNDQRTFKAYVGRWLAVTTQLVPSLHKRIWPYIQASAAGAAGQCDGGTDGITCGQEWNTTNWDGMYGVGEQMSALAFIQALLLDVDGLKSPMTLTTGATSKSNLGSRTGSSSNGGEPRIYTRQITTGDRAGAVILTLLVLVAFLAGGSWMVFEVD